MFLLKIISFLATVIFLEAKCPKGFVEECGPIDGCRKTCNNLNPFTKPTNPNCFLDVCENGCFCPKKAPIETCDENFNIRCISNTNKCICPDGQIFKTCSSVGQPTCNQPKIIAPPVCGKPKCQCPTKTPIWHRGKCITEKNCICPNNCVTSGCSLCNKCRCKNGRPAGCTKKKCPDIYTKDGLARIMKNGCWRLCPSGKQCIFYSPCPDNYGENQCNPPSGPTVNNRFCKKCQICRCDAGHPLCTGNNDCRTLVVEKGCWTLVKGTCTFVSPCPEEADESCRCLNPGTRSCKMCKKCECVNGLKVCDGPNCCPHPHSDGCIIQREYPGVPKRCYFVSPCPSNSDTEPSICRPIDIYKDFCYLCDEKEDKCEFIAPCPKTATCCDGDTICKKCNECTCKDGNIKCNRHKCGNPIPKGCWTNLGTGCVFVSPCPDHPPPIDFDFCKNNPGKSFCSECNTCSCVNGSPICTEIACEQVTEKGGCYVPKDGTCIFMFPCPN